MISRNIESKLSEILITLAEEERNVEITRQVLSENKEYNPYQIFCYLDNNKKNKINEKDIINYLKLKNIYSNENEVKLLILFYDKDLDNNLNFEEFINLIQSKTYNNKNEIKEINEPICFTIEYTLTKLLEKEIIYARTILSLFNDIKGYSDFNIHNLFHCLTNENNNYIEKKDLINFLNKNYVSFIDNDIDLIFNRLDLAKDKLIDLCELHMFFGFPYCEYNCPFLKCDNCGIELCNLCKIDEPCKLHKISNFKNNENNKIAQRTYKTYYTEFRNKLEDNNNDNIQFNNGYQKISDNLILNLSPKREYAPFEVSLNSNLDNNNNKDIKNVEIINDENFNTINQNFTKNSNNQNYIINTINKENINNINRIQNESSEKINNESKINLNNENILKSNLINEDKIDNFIDYLKEAMKQENKIENLKIELSLRSDFNWEEVFRIFELEGRGFLLKEDIIKGFNKFEIYPKDIDILLLLKRYDLKKEGIISYPDFYDIIVPHSKYHRLMIENRKLKTISDEILPTIFNLKTQNCIKNLFIGILNGEFILNQKRENLLKIQKNFIEIFKIIDIKGNGYIGEKEFALFLKNYNIFENNNSCDLLFLRLNKLRNGKIEYHEFIDEIEPLY